ncbi:MAG: helix-turn-helix domain-containing protein [Pirellulales bacterium]|nr:helix-turn-helix domain-containing protein [Pirellulales bacterium]
MKTSKPLTEQLRQAIIESGETRYKISKATGIGQDVLSRFVHGERGLSMDVMDTLGQYLELELRRRPAKRKAKGR